MNFELTEERQMLQDTLRRFLRDRYDTATRNKILNSDTGMSSEIWSELADLGVIGALFTEEQGGFGGKGFDIAVVFEELGRAGVVEPFLDTAVLAGGLIADLGNEDQQAHIETIIEGKLQLAFAHGEPASRYDLTRVSTTASEKGDEIILNGRKAVVVNAEAADVLVVSARESGEQGDADGISLFLVPRDAKGLTIQGYALLAGGRAAEVTLDDVVVPASARLGAAGDASSAIEARIAAANVAQTAETLGAMDTACRLTKDYLLTRKQFGRPIATFQALAHRMSDLLIEMEQARSAVILIAGHLEADRGTRERHVSATKNLIGRVGRLVGEESIQLHGGIAMTQEYELAHIAKRIVMADHRFGDVDHHLERFIALAAA
ncbi:acyl-CoA dehydrogenase family protein [Sulfitobacter guttiformis]|uniref:Alkylation response protein AidB-like acyl-CoA dehydrogenase n=1 Tax=Sulfitobacter guttiformis TaxID=74349 RepID=A0A420DTL1_9RHOB|nr:acyl-CoA dehydrogenase family protein [Sulfitobacter guttiformis]KIN71193.1 Acyl-CoA dehydrogenase family protein [Sulfitobacter guttiformis KCTC 32187]RKE97664.1 alkylation response protein AidB-like acyl-CoA dehydrogenase [Sulfitobacter guttiformis]